jgi:hypothetical protein
VGVTPSAHDRVHRWNGRYHRTLIIDRPPLTLEISQVTAPWARYAEMVYFHYLLDALVQRGPATTGIAHPESDRRIQGARRHSASRGRRSRSRGAPGPPIADGRPTSSARASGEPDAADGIVILKHPLRERSGFDTTTSPLGRELSGNGFVCTVAQRFSRLRPRVPLVATQSWYDTCGITVAPAR